MGGRPKEEADPQLLQEQKSFIGRLSRWQPCTLSAGLQTSNRGVVDHSSLHSLGTIHHFSAACGVFSPMESHKSGAPSEHVSSASPFQGPISMPGMLFLPEKGISDLGPTSEMKCFVVGYFFFFLPN